MYCPMTLSLICTNIAQEINARSVIQIYPFLEKAYGRLKTFLRNSFSQRSLCYIQAALSTSEHVISPIGETLILEI